LRREAEKEEWLIARFLKKENKKRRPTDMPAHADGRLYPKHCFAAVGERSANSLKVQQGACQVRKSAPARLSAR
jgi:hypothetical protein